jgi:hypothetical protein
VGVVSGVEEVLAVELTEDHCEEDVADGNCTLRVGALNSLEARESAFIVERVEVLEGIAGFRGEVDGVCVSGRIVGLRVGRSRQQEGEAEAEDGHAATYNSSPALGYKALRQLISPVNTLIQRVLLW